LHAEVSVTFVNFIFLHYNIVINSIDNQEPIVAQLIANSSISLKKSEMKARKSDIVKGLLGKREKNDHSLAIKFQWNDQQYESTDYINIDKAGSFPLSVSKKVSLTFYFNKFIYQYYYREMMRIWPKN
jgi:hypothetical protein